MCDSKAEERRKMMEEILNDHYAGVDETVAAETENHFYFESFNGVTCEMRNGSTNSTLYSKFKIGQSSNIQGQNSFFSVYCFIPQTELEEMQRVRSTRVPATKNVKSIRIPYDAVTGNMNKADFPNSKQNVYDVSDSEILDIIRHIRSNDIFIITKPAFQQIEHKVVVDSPEKDVEPPKKRKHFLNCLPNQSNKQLKPEHVIHSDEQENLTSTTLS